MFRHTNTTKQKTFIINLFIYSLLILIAVTMKGQNTFYSVVENFKKDKDLQYASYGFCVLDAQTGKIIKELIYLSPLSKNQKNIPSFYTETANTIGLWHDKQLVLQLLMPNPAANKEAIQKLQESCDQELRHLDESVANHYALH